ncbi:MAG: M28 family peptidase [Anaerovoracaceae bacterium]
MAGRGKYDDTFKDTSGEFVRLPDSHTLWGAGSISGLFADGYFLNDLYMYATQSVIKYHDNTFRVDVCPYEGGSDHSRFLAQGIPALLTWHFTDYTYHTSVDTLNMSSADEMENVGITSLATALIMANATDDNEELAVEMLTEVRNAAFERFEKEQQNTLNHQIYAKGNGGDYKAALANEKEVLNAWEAWYQEALLSVEKDLLDNPSAEYKALRAQYQLEIELRLDQALAFAEEMIAENPQHTELTHVPAAEATEDADGNIEYWYCAHCGVLRR